MNNKKLNKNDIHNSIKDMTCIRINLQYMCKTYAPGK